MDFFIITIDFLTYFSTVSASVHTVAVRLTALLPLLLSPLTPISLVVSLALWVLEHFCYTIMPFVLDLDLSFLVCRWAWALLACPY